MTVESDRRSQYRELRVLEILSDGEPLTQRALATRLGVALGLANLYVKRLVRKGYLKCLNVQPNRIRYLLTPQGMAEKARLTYAFIGYSLEMYSHARGQVREALRKAAAHGTARIAIFGAGEAAELTYLTLREQGFEPVAIFDHVAGAPFLGHPVLAIADHAAVDFNILVVATLERPAALVSMLVGLGIPGNRLLLLHDSIADLTPRTEEANLA